MKLHPCKECKSEPEISISNCFYDGKKHSGCCQSVEIFCPHCCRNSVIELVQNQTVLEAKDKAIKKWNSQQGEKNGKE